MKRVTLRTATVVYMFLACHAALAGKWDYSADTDKMTGKLTSFAELQSTNSLSLAAPYGGTNYGQITVRQHPQYGLDVIVAIYKGQLLCAPYEGCSVKIRFGENAPMTFGATPPQDLDHTYIFLRNAKGFIEQASKVRSIKVQMNIYKGGAPVLEFESPDPLVWGKKSK